MKRYHLETPLGGASHGHIPGFHHYQVKQKDSNLFRTTISYSHEIEVYKPILPGLPDDIAKYCLALVAWHHFPVVGCVCKKWRSVVQSNEFSIIRKHARKLEERIYFLCSDKEGKGSHWEVFTSSGHQQTLLPMPGPAKAAFGVVTFNSKILVMGGYIVNEGPNKISADVYQYDCRLNRSRDDNGVLIVLHQLDPHFGL
ncbi:F-box/kelch-repeat protein [Nymphaea thermarum]|nr:F-box/kelch-repeat protein [Nymphaea thermarum]